ncbi:MAG: SMC-Scp complex subunit ScpB [Candidatus Aminicenantia bacterium]
MRRKPKTSRPEVTKTPRLNKKGLKVLGAQGLEASIIEALIFISNEPLTVDKIAEILKDVPKEKITQALEELAKSYKNSHHGIHIIKAGGGYLFTTKPKYDSWIKRLLNIKKQSKLSPAALETLAAIAYHQPVTLPEISALRGVDSSYTLRTLLKLKFIKIVGRKKTSGRPLIYRTTKEFLTYFGLNSLEDLPSIEELKDIIEEENASFPEKIDI